MNDQEKAELRDALTGPLFPEHLGAHMRSEETTVLAESLMRQAELDGICPVKFIAASIYSICVTFASETDARSNANKGALAKAFVLALARATEEEGLKAAGIVKRGATNDQG